jgi:phage shock protein A
MPKLKDLLTRVVMRMADDLVEAKNDVALAKSEEQRLASLAEICARAADEWDGRARAAVRAGDDGVAKEALLRKREHQREADEVRVERQKQHEEIQRLTTLLSDWNVRVEAAKGKVNAVLSRAKRAQAEDSIASLVEESEREAPLEILARLETKLAAIEDEAGLLPELDDRALESMQPDSDARLAEADLILIKGSETANQKRSPASREQRTKR